MRNQSKTVFASISDVIHTFAQRTHAKGRSGNVFFEHDTLYSYGYHYLLAEFDTNKDGNLYVVINDKGYSVSTSRHIDIATAALRQYKRFFTTNINPRLVAEYLEDEMKKLVKARKPEIYINNILTKINSFNEYVEFEPLMKQTTEFKTYGAGIKEIHNKVLSISEGNKGILDALKKHASDKAKKERESRLKREKIEMDDFMNYKINYCSLQNDVLRISNNALHVETNQGVRIGVSEAKLLYKAIKNGVDVEGKKVGNYRINKLTKKHLIAGCHKISLKSVKEIGEQLI